MTMGEVTPPLDHSIGTPRLAEVYSRTAAFYDEVASAERLVARPIALELLGAGPEDKLLEIGCGTGWAMEELGRTQQLSLHVATDIAPGMLDVARWRQAAAGLHRVRLMQADAAFLPFSAEAFDCVLCTYTLDVMDLATVAVALAEARRVLRPGGRLVTANLTPGEGKDAAATEDWGERFKRDPEYFGGARPLRIRPLLERAGFAVAERRYSAGGAGWPSEAIKSVKPS